MRFNAILAIKSAALLSKLLLLYVPYKFIFLQVHVEKYFVKMKNKIHNLKSLIAMSIFGPMKVHVLPLGVAGRM